MLVLTRKRGEVLQIGKDIFITIVDVDSGKVRIGIDAPRDVPVFRKELLDAPPPERKGGADAS